MTTAENGRPELSRARTSSIEMHFTKVAGSVAAVVQRATSANHGARARASPSTT